MRGRAVAARPGCVPGASDPTGGGDVARLDDELEARDERGRSLAADPLTGQVVGRRPVDRHHRAKVGAWIAVLLIILGFTLGDFALSLHSTILWVLTAVALVIGGIVALASRIMDQVY
jgi:hypothetical protein